jgi:hypothetical protein
MLFQFLKQNKIYLIIFILNISFDYFSRMFFQRIMGIFPFLGDDYLTLPTMIFSGLYFIIMACGIVHFGVFCFYEYKSKLQTQNLP